MKVKTGRKHAISKKIQHSLLFNFGFRGFDEPSRLSGN
jgi:hypothetical protein